MTMDSQGGPRGDQRPGDGHGGSALVALQRHTLLLAVIGGHREILRGAARHWYPRRPAATVGQGGMLVS
jgi:hypothetical protein